MQKILSSLIVSVILHSERNIPPRKPLGENATLRFYETNVAWTRIDQTHIPQSSLKCPFSIIPCWQFALSVLQIRKMFSLVLVYPAF